ncbi:MAG: purple acid phosphatase family protein [Ilumatobacteraceae bacterium]
MGRDGPGELHFEPFVHLVDVTDQSALVAWGGFFLCRRDDKGWFVVDDDDLPDGRTSGGTIGVESAPYGEALVEVFDEDGAVISSATTADHNHVWVEGLQPDRTYQYRISVDGRPWADGERCDWQLDGDGDGDGGGLVRSGRRYDLRLRTHPRSDDPAPVAVLAIGDYGVGIVNGDDGRRQLAVARSLEHLADRHAVRALVSLGDNIYHGPEDQLAQTGDEDDDWYFTFYAPYRYLIDHLPMYPTAGNHDGVDEEDNDDRAQLKDNFHLAGRFMTAGAEGLASCDPGLFYRVPIGGLLELVCVDTTWGDDLGHHFFDDEQHREWLDATFPPLGDGTSLPRWRIPFCHHPPWCAGPHHDGQVEQLPALVPRYERSGVRLVLSGHEHNFQHSVHGALHHIVSGAGAKLDERRPTQWATAETQAWAAEAHCLLIEAEPSRLVVTPWGVPGADGDPVALMAEDAHGAAVAAGFVITA